jgi:hypothetical protein
MAFEGLLLIVGTFLVLAISFWRAANRPTGERREHGVSHGSEPHRV